MGPGQEPCGAIAPESEEVNARSALLSCLMRTGLDSRETSSYSPALWAIFGIGKDGLLDE
jgi:hypothetical protein